LFVLTEYTNVTDRRTDEETPHNGTGHLFTASCGKNHEVNISRSFHFCSREF